MTHLAANNQPEVSTSVGTLISATPIHETEPAKHAAEFTLSAGLGYIPLRFSGLHRHDGWRLEAHQQGNWTRVDQSVNGNDYLQTAIDELNETYTLTFTLENTENTQYRLIRD